ncbi:uncharacterized protein [Coffea arabica]|uniref:Retrotransposon gag protein n=1 Tax=Coffea arabica TaxID=13443 RepID=A0ABM4X5C0_COFAR
MTNAQTIRELAAPNLNQQPLCITFSSLNDNTPFELKSDLIHLLPSFHSLLGEEPYKHLQEFDVVCNSMKLPEITEEQIKMRVFPFSLKDSAKDWLYYLPSAMRNVPQVKAYEVCTALGHSTEMCLLVQEESVEQVNMAGQAPTPRNLYDSYSNTYNPGCRDHPNFSYEENRQSNFAPNRQQGYQQQYHRPPPSHSNSSSSIEKMMKQLIANQQKTDFDLQSMRNQLGQVQAMQSQMAIAINHLETQVYGKLLSQLKLNLKNDKDEERIEKELEKEGRGNKDPKVLPDPIITVKTNLSSFPSRLEKPKKQNKEKEILEMFRKVAINIPLLDAIKQVLKYVKFLKNLCVNKKKLRQDEHIVVGENVSAILQRKLPPKCGDPVGLNIFLYYDQDKNLDVPTREGHAKVTPKVSGRLLILPCPRHVDKTSTSSDD